MVASVPVDLPSIIEVPPRRAAQHLYALSRDLYAPVLTNFAARCLDELRVERGGLNICLARDGISLFLAQRVLLHVAPARFHGVAPRQVQLAYLSRHLARDGSHCTATRALVESYLNDQGLRHARSVTFVDIGIHGTIQDELQRWYPTYDIRGHYLIYHRRSGDPNASRKRGYLVGDPAAEDATYYLRREVIHLLEDLWSGVYESVTVLRPATAQGRGVHVHPVLQRLGTRSRLRVRTTTLRRLKRAALRGVVDGVAQAACVGKIGRLRGVAGRNQITDQAQQLADWIASTREEWSPDAWLWRALIRPDRAHGGRWDEANE
jgi:hypothetical protein